MSGSPDNPKRKRIITLAAVVLGILVLFLLFRPAVLSWGMGKVSSKIGQALTDVLGVEVAIDTMEMEGLSRVMLKDITATPNEDTPVSASLGKVEVSYDLKSLFSKGGLSAASLNKVVIKDGDISLKLKEGTKGEFKTVEDILEEIFVMICDLGFSGHIEISNSNINLETAFGVFDIYVTNLEATVNEALKIDRFSCEVNGVKIDLTGKLFKSSDKVRAELVAGLKNLDLNRLFSLEMDPEHALFESANITINISEDIEIEKVEAYHAILEKISGSAKLKLEESGLFAQGEVSLEHPENLKEIIPEIPDINKMPIKINLTPETLDMQLEDVLVQGINTSLKANARKEDKGYIFNLVANFGEEALLKADGSWREDAGFESNVDVENINIELLRMILGENLNEEYYAYFANTKLNLKGKLQGSVEDLKGEGKVILSGLEVIESENLEIDLTYEDGQIKSDYIQLDTEFGEIEALIECDIKESALNFAAFGSHIDIFKVKEAFNLEFEATGYLNLMAEGKYNFAKADDIYLEVEIEEGTVKLPVLEDVLDEITGKGTYSNGRITINSFDAKTVTGQVSASGVYDAKDMVCDLKMEANSLRLSEAGVSGDLGFALNLTKDKSGGAFSGNIELKDIVVDLNTLSISGDMASGTSSTSLESSWSTGFSQQLPFPEWMEEILLDVTVDTISALRVTGSEIDVRVKPNSIKLGGTLRTPSFSGNIDISGGKARLLGTDFEVVEGNIYFLGMKPHIFVVAQPRLGRDVKVRVSGSIDNLTVETYGSDAERLGFTNEELKDEIVKLLDPRLRLYLIYDLEEVLVSRGIISDMELLRQKDGNYELQLGKEISDDIYVTYKKSFTVGGSDSVEIEYKINPNLTMTGNFMSNNDAMFKLDAKFKF